MVTKRELVLDAAIDLLGSRGTRALTHRAVDEAAGMPAGSASNYFRTRRALLAGVAQRLEDRDYADWEALTAAPAPRTIDELVEGMTNFVVHAARTDRVRTLARYALFLESQGKPALRDTVRRGHQRLTEWAGDLLAGIDAERADARILVDYIDGVILHQLIRPEAEFDPRESLTRVVRGLVSGPRR